ncbi:hypothetical protein SAMN06265379_101204 [Saccharicrinis carchari]|uniref:Uncharacterized protein n=1 Tax=Saccharicrinis carchari TaxID=1168039 RepID=A0A521AKB9_SACCC|nr:hypothetical protein SAMN06265379_101204 [Saccharicrinis carchari]
MYKASHIVGHQTITYLLLPSKAKVLGPTPHNLLPKPYTLYLTT